MWPISHATMFFGMIIAHLFIMLPLMVVSLEDYYISLNQTYNAIFMGLLMVVIEATMHPMPIWAWVLTLVLIMSIVICIRFQIGITDAQYLRDMIPHHSMALLTSEHRKGQGRVQKLATEITKTQKKEIAEMKSLLQILN